MKIRLKESNGVKINIKLGLNITNSLTVPVWTDQINDDNVVGVYLFLNVKKNQMENVLIVS